MYFSNLNFLQRFLSFICPLGISERRRPLTQMEYPHDKPCQAIHTTFFVLWFIIFDLQSNLQKTNFPFWQKHFWELKVAERSPNCHCFTFLKNFKKFKTDKLWKTNCPTNTKVMNVFRIRKLQCLFLIWWHGAGNMMRTRDRHLITSRCWLQPLNSLDSLTSLPSTSRSA